MNLTIPNFDKENRQFVKLQLEEKKAEIDAKRSNIADMSNKNAEALEKVKIDKINVLSDLLTSHIVDADKNVPGCDPMLIPAFNETEQYTIKAKLFDIIKTL